MDEFDGKGLVADPGQRDHRALRLVSGETIEAAALGISAGTARHQPKAIFAKTGTNRRPALVALLWRVSDPALGTATTVLSRVRRELRHIRGRSGVPRETLHLRHGCGASARTPSVVMRLSCATSSIAGRPVPQVHTPAASGCPRIHQADTQISEMA